MMMRYLLLLLAVVTACAPTLSRAQSVSGCGTASIAKADANSIPKLTTGADCFGKAKATAAAAEQARRERIAVLLPPPVVTPPASAKPVRLFVGDSLSIFWPGNHTGVHAKAHPDVDVRSEAVGGSGVAQVTGARLTAALAMKPRDVVIFFGANDLDGGGYATEGDWWAAERALGAKFAAIGADVRYGTVLPQCDRAEHNRRATAINARMRAEAKVVDYAAQAGLADPCDKSVYADGVHPLDATAGKVDGQGLLAKADEAAFYGVVYPPLPQPPVIPSAAFVPTATVSPSLEGVAKVASGLNVAALLQPAWGNGAIPGPEAPGIEGAFRFLCAPSHVNYDDMVVHPNEPGASHLHQWSGNPTAVASSTYESLRKAGGSTCNSEGNRSAYAMPAMMHPTGKVVPPDWDSIYYKRAPAGSIYCKPPYAKACLALPRGLRYVFGYDLHNPSNPANTAPPLWFNCDGPGAVSGHFRTIPEAAKGCPTGARLGALVVGPNCWTGTALDSPDHRSHMAYQSQDGFGHNACPSTHPYLLPFFEIAAWFTNDGTAGQWCLSSDPKGVVCGTTLHSDWFGAWEDDVKDAWTVNCIDKALSCNGGDLGNGTQLRTDKGYDYPHGRPMLDPPAMPVTMAGMTH